MVARVVPQSARRRHAESRKPDLRGGSAGGRWAVLEVRDEHGYAASPAEILRWAIDDYSPGPVVPSAGTEASLARYRDALLTFHRESKRVRYAQRADAAPQHPRAL